MLSTQILIRDSHGMVAANLKRKWLSGKWECTNIGEGVVDSCYSVFIAANETIRLNKK